MIIEQVSDGDELTGLELVGTREELRALALHLLDAIEAGEGSFECGGADVTVRCDPR